MMNAVNVIHLSCPLPMSLSTSSLSSLPPLWCQFSHKGKLIFLPIDSPLSPSIHRHCWKKKKTNEWEASITINLHFPLILRYIHHQILSTGLKGKFLLDSPYLLPFHLLHPRINIFPSFSSLSLPYPLSTSFSSWSMVCKNNGRQHLTAEFSTTTSQFFL